MKSSSRHPLIRARWLLAGGIALAGLLAGCATTGARIQARIDEKPEVFAKLTKQQQKDIKWGYVRLGYSPEMVYFAYGKPDQVITSPDHESYVWVFLDRTAVNQDVALMSAMRDAGGSGGKLAKMWGSHNDNYAKPPGMKGLDVDPAQEGPKSSAEAYTVVDALRAQPTIWVAFRNDRVVNVRRIGGPDLTDKTGSLGG